MPDPSAFTIIGDDDSDLVPWTAIVNTPPMANSSTTIATQALSLASDNAVLAVANSKTAVRYIDNGVLLNGTPLTGDVIVFTDSVTTSGGNAVFSLTTNHTPTGTAYCSSILTRSISTGFVDNTGLYAQGIPTIGSLKTITVPVNKQTSSGVTVLGIGVLAAISNSAAPDGVTVNLFAVGVAA